MVAQAAALINSASKTIYRLGQGVILRPNRNLLVFIEKSESQPLGLFGRSTLLRIR
jgi:hypothetical protein